MQTLPLQQPPGHEVPSQMHAPMEQRCPAAHVVPQPPQLPLPFCTSTHTPLHHNWPAGQVHTPLVQGPPLQLAHALPELPHIVDDWLA